MEIYNYIQKRPTGSAPSGGNVIPFLKRISVRVTLIILVILSLGIGGTVYYYPIAQNTSIITSRENAIMDEGEILYKSIKNNMLAGEAPIAVDLFRGLRVQSPREAAGDENPRQHGPRHSMIP